MTQIFKAPLWLDADTTPPRKSRYSRRKSLAATQREATLMLQYVREGQIGFYTSAHGGAFHGYMIKQNGEVFFEAPDASEAA